MRSLAFLAAVPVAPALAGAAHAQAPARTGRRSLLRGSADVIDAMYAKQEQAVA